MSLNDLGQFLNLVLGGVVVALITAGVAAWRRLKSGAIVDDDAVIARLDADNVRLRKERKTLAAEVEKERRARWRAEDIAAQYRRQLMENGLTPVESFGGVTRGGD